MPILEELREWGEAISALFWPPKCPACRAAVSRHGEWCASCLMRAVAPRQIAPLERRLAFLDSCLVLCPYAGDVRKILHGLKFRRRKKDAVYLEWLLERGTAGAAAFSATDGAGVRHAPAAWAAGGETAFPEAVAVAVPVPLHSRRLAERGFNQTEVIFRGWAARRGMAFADALSRIIPTAPQWELNLKARRQNIKGAFLATRPEAVRGKRILLVDDIFTTGATMDECAAVLKAAGAIRVDALALAGG